MSVLQGNWGKRYNIQYSGMSKYHLRTIGVVKESDIFWKLQTCIAEA